MSLLAANARWLISRPTVLGTRRLVVNDLHCTVSLYELDVKAATSVISKETFE